MPTIKHTLGNIYQKISSFSISTPGAILLGAALISFSHIAYAFIIAGDRPTVATTNFSGRPIDATDFVTGNTESDVLIVAYSDTECPFCAQLHPTLEQLQEKYADTVAFAYRYFPLTQIHPNAFDEARAIFCVGKVAGSEKRSKYINDIFNYKLANKNMTFPKNGKEDLAKNIGINEAAFTSCLNSQESSDIVSASIQDGIEAGVEGTPATFILAKTKKGYETVSMIGGAQSITYFEAALDEALSR